MKILIDATTTQDQYASRGIGRVTKELVTALVERSARLKNDDQYVLLLFNAPTTLNDLVQKHPSRLRTVNIGKLRLSGKFDFIWWPLQYARAIRREVRQGKPDVYLCPNILRGYPRRGIPVVAMVHDFAFHQMGRYSLGPKWLDWVRKNQYHRAYNGLRNISAIATISNHTKDDLFRYVNDLKKPVVKTIYLGVSSTFCRKKPAMTILEKYMPRRVIDQGYLLYYGGLEVNKNVPAIIHGYVELRRMWEKRFGNTLICPFLVLAGGDFTQHDVSHPILAEIRELINKLDLDEYVCFTGYYEERHTVHLLNGARLFMHLSLYEGFGFSPLEAMKCGIPVVASDRSCYPETLGTGALLVNPERPHAVAKACMQILTDDAVCTNVSTAGMIKAAQYTWASTAKQMSELFAQVANIGVDSKETPAEAQEKPIGTSER